MFPRPSRIFRLLIFLVLIFLSVTSFYVFTSYPSYQETKPDLLMQADRSLRFNPVVTSGITQANTSRSLKSDQQGMLTDNGPQTNLLLRDERKSMNVPAFNVTGKNWSNPHSFPYVHNPIHTCRGQNRTLLVYIHSSPLNFKKRQAVRQTWGHPSILSLYNARLVFMLGSGYDRSVQGLVDMEAATYMDIVQEDFVDSYRNLTYKGIAALRWASTYCSKSDFVLKTDDDILIDIVSFIEDLRTHILPKRPNSNELILCNLWTRMKVIRDPKSKWYISKQEFSGEYFPAYCSGSAFLISSDLVPRLYETALNTPFFWVDDFYITGLLVKKLNVQHTRYNEAYLLNSNLAEEKLVNDTNQLKVFHVKKLKLFLKLWPIILKRHKTLADKLDSQGLNKIINSEQQNNQNLDNVSTVTG